MAKKRKPAGFVRHLAALVIVFGGAFAPLFVLAHYQERQATDEKRGISVPGEEPGSQRQLGQTYPLETTDGYFQVGIDRPQHLMDDPPARQFAHLGDTVRFWLDFRVRFGWKVPCTTRDEAECRFGVRRIKPDTDVSAITWEDKYDSPFRVPTNEEIGFSTSQDIQRDSELGDRLYLVYVRHGQELLFTFTVPVTIVE